jgi:general secretion pathway protein D
MRPRINLRNKFGRISRLILVCLLASILCWRTPSYVLAQDAPKDSAKKDAAEENKTTAAEAASTGKKSPSDAEKRDAARTDTGAGAGDGDKSKETKAGDSSKDDKNKDKDKNSDEIQLSFQGANVDMIVQWLAQNTGKTVIKHPRVQCQLTITGSKKITKREALNLVYRALALEGFTAIESSKAIMIVPEGQEPKMSAEMLNGKDIPEGRQKLVKIFPLSHLQAAEVKDKVKSALSEKGTVEADERANQLIVTDYNENLSLASQLIAVLDSDKPQDVAVRVIPLKNVSAQDLVKEVAPLYQKLSNKGAKETIEVAANERSNSLLILASEANFKGISAVVEMLDTDQAQEKVLRAFTLKNAEAQDVAKQLQDLNSDQDNSNRYPFFFYSDSGRGGNKNNKKMTVVADRRRNTVIVQAAPSLMDGIAKIVESLDEPITDNNLAPRIYPLKYVSAGDLEDILNELFLKKRNERTYWNYYEDYRESSSVDRDVGRLYGKVRITSEPHSNSLILTSNSEENMEAVEAVIKQLDVPSEAGDTTLRVGLKFAKATTVANNINILFAKGGSPPVRPVAPQGQQQQQQQQQQQNQNSIVQSEFELGQDAREEGYFPWLGGQPDNARTQDGRSASRPVSDLVGRVRAVPDQRSNSLLIQANVHFFPQVLKIIEELDAPTAQVLIEARIVEVSTDFLSKLGVRWSPDGTRTFSGDDFDNSILIGGNNTYYKTYGPMVAQALSSSLSAGVLSSAVSLDFLVQFLRRTTDATVLAEPQINIADNEIGRLFVGSQVPFIDKSLSTDVGGLNQSFSYKNVGVILEVTPHINSSGDVALKIRTESSAIEPGVTLLGGAVLDTRNFKTDLTARDGETLVLGGIIQKQNSDILRKTPILGDIPGLGWAFKKRDKTSREVELMVFLRPKVVRSPAQARELLEEIDKKAPKVKKWQDDSHPSNNNDSDKKKQS